MGNRPETNASCQPHDNVNTQPTVHDSGIASGESAVETDVQECSENIINVNRSVCEVEVQTEIAPPDIFDTGTAQGDLAEPLNVENSQNQSLTGRPQRVIRRTVWQKDYILNL